jgi:formamidopyrimidine-DNA glycosylase
MPELPEVETIKNEISPKILFKRIKEIVILWNGVIKTPSPEDFAAMLKGKEFHGIERHGKYLFFSLNMTRTLIMHLKMSGSLLVTADAEVPKYTRAYFEMEDGTYIYFRDPRKFGGMWLVENTDKVIGKLGPDAMNRNLTEKRLSERLVKHKAPIKAVLCDQSVVAGIGNMYADEALFVAKIHPMRSAASLTPEELKRLYAAIREVLLKGIKNKGASIVNYYRPDGSKGTAHEEFCVAHGKGKACPVCGTPIERIVVRGRGTYFCPNCQQLL